jgi:hypothetical protein
VDAFARFATGNGLVLNAAKTQLMVGGNVKNRDVASFRVSVNGIEVSPAKEMELLGVKFDNNFTTSPHDTSVSRSARQHAALIARLAHHLPRGEYLRQLARGLVILKIGFALAAVVAPRLGAGGGRHSGSSLDIIFFLSYMLVLIYLMTFLREIKKIPHTMRKTGPWRSKRFFSAKVDFCRF